MSYPCCVVDGTLRWLTIFFAPILNCVYISTNVMPCFFFFYYISVTNGNTLRIKNNIDIFRFRNWFYLFIAFFFNSLFICHTCNFSIKFLTLIIATLSEYSISNRLSFNWLKKKEDFHTKVNSVIKFISFLSWYTIYNKINHSRFVWDIWPNKTVGIVCNKYIYVCMCGRFGMSDYVFFLVFDVWICLLFVHFSVWFIDSKYP